MEYNTFAHFRYVLAVQTTLMILIMLPGFLLPLWQGLMKKWRSLKKGLLKSSRLSAARQKKYWVIDMTKFK